MTHPSMGVEEELLLVSASGRPLPRSKAVAAEAEGIDVELELTQAQVEINLPVCDTPAELRDHLQRLRSQLARAQFSAVTRYANDLPTPLASSRS